MSEGFVDPVWKGRSDNDMRAEIKIYYQNIETRFRKI